MISTTVRLIEPVIGYNGKHDGSKHLILIEKTDRPIYGRGMACPSYPLAGTSPSPKL